MYPPLTPEEIAAIARVESNMDNGTQPFVRDEQGRRWAFTAEILQQTGCICGQTVDKKKMIFIMETNLANLQMQIALEKAGVRPFKRFG